MLCLAGFFLSVIFGVRAMIWIVSHKQMVQDPEGDPLVGLEQMWLVLRLPVLGFLLFVGSWLWALGTSLAILREAKAHDRPIPPKLG